MAARAFLIATACSLATDASAADPASSQVREAVEQVLSDPRYQRTRPDGSLPTFERPPEADFDLPDFAPRSFEPSTASGVSEALLWVLLAVFGVVLLAVLGREATRFVKRRKRRKKKKKSDGLDGDGLDIANMALERLPETLARARELAAEGRFEEAVHVLLEGSLQYLHALANFSLEPAFTSREVLGQAPLTSETRRAFGNLVGAVEVSLFGGFAVAAEDFARCEESFVTLHRRLGGGHGG